MAKPLLAHLREVVGLPMGSWYAPITTTNAETGGYQTTRRVIGWTTDAAKAEAAREAGALVYGYTSFDPACSGWEIVVRETVDDGRSS